MSHDKELTKRILGDVGPLRFNPKVVKVCVQCKRQDIVRYKGGGKPSNDYYCRSCIVNRPEVKQKLSNSTKKQWEDPQFAELVKKNSEEIWNDPDRRTKMSKCRTDPEFIRKLIIRNKTRTYNSNLISSNMKTVWENEEYRKKMSIILGDISRKSWQNELYRANIVAKMAVKRHDPAYKEKFRKLWENPVYRAKVENIRVSSIQTTLYSILDDLGIKYYREYQDLPHDPECKIGPYSFDCVVPRAGKTTLLIECQGEYWHNRPKSVIRDKAKATFISNNHSHQYELKCIWEHEFLSPNKVSSLIKYWMGLEDDVIDYDFKDVVIKPVDHKPAKLLLSKYHYIHSAGRHGVNYGAFLGDELIAVAVFSFLPRQNISFDGFGFDETRDLSRFCIHPKYRKKNLGSWFLKKCMKLLDSNIRLIVSYADTTFNHYGSMYKASNFVLDKVVPPDYWYVSEDGWIMHKKTLYNQAVNLRLTESAYAESHGYVKIWGKEKLRFIFKR